MPHWQQHTAIKSGILPQYAPLPDRQMHARISLPRVSELSASSFARHVLGVEEGAASLHSSAHTRS